MHHFSYQNGLQPKRECIKSWCLTNILAWGKNGTPDRKLVIENVLFTCYLHLYDRWRLEEMWSDRVGSPSNSCDGCEVYGVHTMIHLHYQLQRK